GRRDSLSGGFGRGQCRHPDECRYADRGRADDGEDKLPGFRRHGVDDDAIGRVKASESGRGGEGERNEQPQPARTQDGEQELADAEGGAGGESSDEESCEYPGTSLMRPDADIQADEEWQREYRKGEEQPAQQADDCKRSEDS